MTVHQPSHRLLETVAGVIVMGPRGRLLYCGPRRLADGRCALAAHFDGDGLCLAELAANPAEALLEAMADEQPHIQQRIARLCEQESARMAMPHLRTTDPTTFADANDASSQSTPLLRGVVARLLGHDADALRQTGGYGAGWAQQMGMLCARHARQVVRHPMLLGVHLGITLAVSLLAGAVFWQTGQSSLLDTGVLARVGLVFFLGLYFMLTALAPLPLWSQERLLYFQERAAGCYGPLAYVLSRIALRRADATRAAACLCAAIVYPMAGLSMAGASGPAHTALFVAALCLANLFGTAVITCIAMVCPSSAVATIFSVLFVLMSTLFCGFIVNLPTLQKHNAWLLQEGGWGPQYLSFLFYLNELVIADEMLGRTITVEAHLEPGKPPAVFTIPGEEVLAHLGYGLNCSHVGGRGDLACWRDIGWPLTGVAFFVALAAMLLSFCVKDPH